MPFRIGIDFGQDFTSHPAYYFFSIQPLLCQAIDLIDGGFPHNFSELSQEILQLLNVYAFFMGFGFEQVLGFIIELAIDSKNFLKYFELVIVENIPSFGVLGGGCVVLGDNIAGLNPIIE